MDYRDRVVIVTGASSGIGRVTARAFAERGAVVVAVARREAELASLVAECARHSPRSHYLAGDLAERAFAESVVDTAARRHGRIDVLVNNAAVAKHKHIHHVSVEEAEYVMNVNFHSCLWMTLAALPHMLRAGAGFVVNVSSFAGRIVPPRESVYAASKAAMNAFTEGLWLDLEGSGVHAALIIPGAIDTEIWEKLDEPAAFRGAKAPPRLVADAIFEAIERRRFEITVPKRRLDLVTARLLRFFCPPLLRFGMRRMDPVPAKIIAEARKRAGESAERAGTRSARGRGARGDVVDLLTFHL